MAGFDEEKEKVVGVLKHAGIINIIPATAGLVGSVGDILTKFQLDPDTMASACVVVSTASSVASLKIPDITTQQILMKVKKIEKGVDKLLKTPLETALDTFYLILDAVETGNFESAYQRLPNLEEDSKKAYHYMKSHSGKMSLESYKETAKACRLHMYSLILRESYDNDKKVFVTPDKLSDKKVNFIGRALERIVRQCIEQKKKVKTKSWGFEQDSVKLDAQNLLDSILAFAYPHVSRAKKLTDLNKNLSDDGLYKFRLLPELLPMGYEDKTQMIVGIKTDEKGEKTTEKIEVWRDETLVFFESNGARFHKPIISEDEPVEMEDAKPVDFTISATGGAKEKWSRYLGDYTFTEEKNFSRPVYSGNKGMYLYSLESGAWAVGYSVNDSKPWMRSMTEAVSPFLCQQWEYWDTDDGYKYKPGDIAVTIKN